MIRAIKNFLINWIFRPRGPEPGPVMLTQRRVFILPTRQGIMYGFMLLMMLTGSINYNLSLGYVLTFLLGTMGIVCILHTFRNLAHLKLRPGKVSPVFAGETASFTICLENDAEVPRYSVGLARGKQDPVFSDLPAHKTVVASLPVPAEKRGLLTPGKLSPFTRFPLGLFHAWSNVELDMRCLVYPRPDSARIPPPALKTSPGEGIEYGLGNDDFLGLRPYHLGDSPRHIAWKAAARGQGLLTKQFSGRAEAELWLDWDELSGMETEARLSRLTRWVLDAHSAGSRYGLRLPGKSIPPGLSEEHRQQCLEALALFKNEG